MATKTVSPAFTVEALSVEAIGRPTYVVRNAEGTAVGVTFSEAKAGRIAAFRTTQLEEAAAAKS